MPRNHNCNVLNVFFIVLSHNNTRSENGQRTVRERSEYSMTVRSTGFGRVTIVINRCSLEATNAVKYLGVTIKPDSHKAS